nr:MAG TPA: hypothetical protein [Bacteriophage sp.]
MIGVGSVTAENCQSTGGRLTIKNKCSIITLSLPVLYRAIRGIYGE